jgi:hypothetical protein
VFERIVGHADVIPLLEKFLQTPKFEGVFLFHGPRSVGKQTVAREFAKLAVCSGSIGGGCACDNCRLFPDVPDYMTVGGGSAKTIKTENARAITSFLSLAPFSGPRRAVVIDDADTMNRQASYSLLKTLEETKGAVIILVSSDESRMNAAIKSRTTPVRFGPLSADEISEILTRQGHSKQNLQDVCRAMPYFSKSVLQDFGRYSCHLNQMPSILKRLKSGAVDEVLSVASEAGEAGETVYFVEAMLSCLSDIVKIHYGAPGHVSNQSQEDVLEALTASWSVEVCIASCARLSEVLDAARSPLNLKPAPRLFAALGWISTYLSQTAKK